MARNPKNPGTVRGGKTKGDTPKVDPSVRVPGGPDGPPTNVFDELAAVYKDLLETLGVPPDIGSAISKLVDDGVAPSEIATQMGNRGVDVSQYLQGVTPPVRTPEAPTTNIPAGEAAPVDAVTDMPEPDAPTPAPSRQNAGQPKGIAQRVYEALAEVGYTEDQILEFGSEDAMTMAIRERPNLFPEFAVATTPAATPAAAAGRPYDSLPAETKAALDAAGYPESDIGDWSAEDLDLTVADVVPTPAATTPDEGQQVAAALRTPIVDAIERASDPNAMPAAQPAAPAMAAPQGPLDPAMIREQIRMMAGQSPTEAAYRFLSDSGISDEVLGGMRDADMIRMAAQLRGQPPIFNPVAGLAQSAPATPMPAPAGVVGRLSDSAPTQPTPASPAPPAPAPAATTPPAAVARLSDAAPAPVAPEPPPLDPGPLEMPQAVNPYPMDIYSQIQMATMGPGVQTRFSPDVAGRAPDATPALQMPPDMASTLNDPNVQVFMPEIGQPAPIPQVLDVGSAIPGGFTGAAPAAQAGRAGGQFRSRVMDMLMGTPASGEQPAKLGLISPEWGNLNSIAEGPVGRLSRFATSPRTLGTIALLKYIAGTGGLQGWGSAAKPIGQAIWDGTQPQEDSQDNDNVDYATNYRAALDRLSRPMSGRGTLALPMVPNSDRPSR